MKYILLALIVAPMLSLSALAAENTLSVGGFLPDNITLQDQSGEEKALRSLIGESGAVIVFYRSAGWCPYCQAQLINLKAHQPDIEAKGYNIIGISYDDVDVLKDFSDKRKISFDLLSDKGSETIKAFGIFNHDNKEGSFAYGVPHPTIYVVDAQAKIKEILREEGYKKRPEVSDIIEAIEK